MLASQLVIGAMVVTLAPHAIAQEEAEPTPVPLVSIRAEDDQQVRELLDAGLDIVDVDAETREVHVVLDTFEQGYVDAHDIDVEVIEENVNEFPDTSITSTDDSERTDYRHLDDYYEELDAVHAAYPDLTRLEVIGHGHEGRPIIALEISSAPGQADGRPEHIHTALTHAREWPTGEFVMDLAWYLTENYGHDDRVTDIVDDVRVWLIPVLNPDGFHYSRTQSPTWRKNRNPAAGVDLNRNFAHMWGGPGSSGDPSSNTYRGTAPFSEPETQALRDFVAVRHPITVIHSHVQGGRWLYPWAHTEDAPPDPELAALAAESVQWSGYRDQQWIDMYQASGESVDWSYEAFRSLSFLPEHGVDHGQRWDYLGTERPGLVTDALGNVEARLLTHSPELDGESGWLLDCGLSLTPSDCPEDIAGNIALIERGEGTYREKALNAINAGAVGVVIYNDRWGHISGTLNEPSVPAPVLGVPQFSGHQLVAALEDGPVNVSLETILAHSIKDVWDVNLPAYLLTIEAAAEHTARITGSVTDATSGDGVGHASVELSLERRAVHHDGGEETYSHETSIDVDADGTFDWAVLPSRQATLETPPYELTVAAPNYYPHTQSVELAGYRDVAELDAALQELARVLNPDGPVRVPVNGAFSFQFETYRPDGDRHAPNDLTVAVYDADGTEIHRFTSEIRERPRGDHQVRIDARTLGLGAGEYQLAIEFGHDGSDYRHTTPMTVWDAPGAGRPGSELIEPSTDAPAVVAAGEAFTATFTANRAWPYVIDFRAAGSDEDWMNFADGTGAGVAATGDNTAELVVPEPLDDGEFDLRVQLFPPDEDADQPRASDVAESALMVAEPVTQFATDFSDQPIGDAPAGWTETWRAGTWTVLDDPPRLRNDVTVGGRRALTWDSPGDDGWVEGDVEVAAVVRMPDAVTATRFQLPLHISGFGGNENAYYLDGRASSIRINRYVDGTFTQMATHSLGYPVEADTWYHVVLRREGTTLSAKLWPYGADEPDEWLVSVTDDNHAAGRVGVSHLTSGAVNEWAWFAVGVAGDEAPRAP
jgi:hypothetical protein